MESIINANKSHVESRKIQNKILKWDDKESPLAKLGALQIEVINDIEELLNTKAKTVNNEKDDEDTKPVEEGDDGPMDGKTIVESTPKFLTLYDQIDDLFQNQFDDVYLEFYNQLENRTKECDVLLEEVSWRAGSFLRLDDKLVIF